MAFVKTIAKGLVGGLIGLAVAGGKKKSATAEPTAPAPLPNRNVAAELARARDEYAKRRGTAAAFLTGARGAEAASGTKTRLGS